MGVQIAVFLRVSFNLNIIILNYTKHKKVILVNSDIKHLYLFFNRTTNTD